MSNYNIINRRWRKQGHSPEMPAHDLVFQILSNRTIMASRCDKSPRRRKMFMMTKRLIEAGYVDSKQAAEAARARGATTTGTASAPSDGELAWTPLLLSMMRTR
jgi:hypothetical protein